MPEICSVKRTRGCIEESSNLENIGSDLSNQFDARFFASVQGFNKTLLFLIAVKLVPLITFSKSRLALAILFCISLESIRYLFLMFASERKTTSL